MFTGGGVPTYAFSGDNVLPSQDTVKDMVTDGDKATGEYFYGVTGGNVYLDSAAKDLLGEVDAVVNYEGDNFIKQIGSAVIKSKLPEGTADVIGVVNDKTIGGSAVIQGDTNRNLNGYALNNGTNADWIRYYGVIGADTAINTGINGNVNIKATINGTISLVDINKEYKAEELNITRVGDSNVIIGGHDADNEGSSVSVIGGVGGSAAAALGNVTIDIPDASKKVSGIADITVGASTLTLDGVATTTLQGNVNTQVEKDANVVGWMNGGLAAGVGGQSTSTVTGNTTLTIDGTDRRTDIGVENHGDSDPIKTGLNVMKGSGINAIGVSGGGTAMTTLGGTAESHVNGTTTINVHNATVLGAIGGGIAGSVDATGVAEEALYPDKQLGNDNGISDVTGSQLEELLNQTGLIPDQLKITATDAIDGGTAKSTTGGTNVVLTGNSTVVGILGGGVAAASHTYTWKNDGTNTEAQGYTVNDEYGTSVAEAATGKSHITIALDNTGLDWTAKSEMLEAVGSFKDKLVNDTNDLQANELEALANKGAAIGVFGGGVAVAQSGNRQFLEQDGNADDTFKGQGAYATATTDGSQMDIQSGYVAGVMGGGIAGAMNNATAKAEMTDTVDINISGVAGDEGEKSTEVVGVFGNGLAYFTGSTTTNGNDGKTAYANLKGTATVSAVNTNVNVFGGSVDGIIGGGMAIDDSDAHRTNAIVETTGKATVNVSGDAVVNKTNLSGMSAIFGKVPTDAIDMASYADGVKAAAGDAAIAAGGIALGGGAEAYVKEGEVHIAGGTVNGNVYGGGIAAYGYDESTGDGEAKGSRVDTVMMNLTGGKIDGNVYAGGAVATETSNGVAVYGSYDQAKATVGTATVNLDGTDVTGVLYGKGTVNQEVVDDADATAAQAAVENSTINLIGENTLSNVMQDGEITSKIQSFNNVNVAANSVTKLDNSVKPGTTALIDGGTVTVDSTARLDISALDKTGSPAYNIAANYNEGSTFWSDDNLIYDRMAAYATSNATAGGKGSLYTITYDTINESNWKDAANSMGKALNAGPVQPLVDQGMKLKWDTNQGISEGAREYFREWMYNPNMNAAFGRGMMIGEDSAVTGNTVSVARDVADEVAQHLSFTEDFVQDHDSIYGDDNIWAKYIHNKFETDGMSSSFGGITADNDYNGVIVGYDFNQSGKLQSGVAIHYGHGDGTGSFTRNDYDAWGVSLYGALKDEEAGTNLMADIGYTKTSNDITGTIAGKDLTADRDLTAWTIGVRGEKEFVSGRNQIVPYVGLRYMNVDPSSYTSYYNGKKAFEYDADKQDIWMVPLGVSFRNETKTGSGWRITPKLDVAYVWAFGDTDNEVDVNMAGASAPLYYTVMDDGSWLASLGIDASHGAWTFGAGYAYQKGDDTKNNKWYVNAGFAF